MYIAQKGCDVTLHRAWLPVLQVMQKRQSQAQQGALATLSFSAMAAAPQIRRGRLGRWPHVRKLEPSPVRGSAESVPAVCMSLAIPC